MAVLPCGMGIEGYFVGLADQLFELLVRDVPVETDADPMFGAEVVGAVYGHVPRFEFTDLLRAATDVATVECIDVKVAEHPSGHIEGQEGMFAVKELVEWHLFAASRQRKTIIAEGFDIHGSRFLQYATFTQADCPRGCIHLAADAVWNNPNRGTMSEIDVVEHGHILPTELPEYSPVDRFVCFVVAVPARLSDDQSPGRRQNALSPQSSQVIGQIVGRRAILAGLQEEDTPCMKRMIW